MINRLTKRAFFAGLDDLAGGALHLTCDGRTQQYGTGTPAGSTRREPLVAAMTVSRDRFFTRALWGADIGIGESFVDGDWSSPDLVALARLMLRNMQMVERQGGLTQALVRAAGGFARRLRDNSITGSRRHIHEHYDLGNDFFRLFLDHHLMYSCAFYATGNESLEQAQEQKLDQICRKLDLQPHDHVLEIGSGWGGFAVWAATRYGCRVTATTISHEQYRHACEWVARLGARGSRIQVLLQDYRELTGEFDKIVSIEMFEAVGLNHYDDYFAAANRLLKPDGSMLLQTITVNDQWFESYHGQPDWIEKYIFPGGELASLGEIVHSVSRATSMSLYHAENIGFHYARTIHAWRGRFNRELDRVRALGFSDRFIRMWDLYLAYCEAAFLERHAGTFQLVLAKNYSPAAMFNEASAGAEASWTPAHPAYFGSAPSSRRRQTAESSASR
jgi:cyclopropane-fatty-acyl-phospholipid synthase